MKFARSGYIAFGSDAIMDIRTFVKGSQYSYTVDPVVVYLGMARWRVDWGSVSSRHSHNRRSLLLNIG